MTRPWNEEDYQRWKDSVWEFFGAARDRYARAGPQCWNAAQAATLRHVRETRGGLSGAGAQAIWSVTGTCDQGKHPILPGDPYLVWLAYRDGHEVEALVCCECQFRPTAIEIHFDYAPGPVPRENLSEARAGARSAIERRTRERWMRQDRLEHRGRWWRERRRMAWQYDPVRLLLFEPRVTGKGIVRRLLARWWLGRLHGRMARAPKDPSREAGRLMACYDGGRRRFVKAGLAGARLRDAGLQGADLSMADLYHAELSNANLRSALLVRADLEKAVLFRADLTGADLQGANLYGAFLVEANLEQANLAGADLSGANLYEARVTGPQLGAAWSLKGALLPGGRLHGRAPAQSPGALTG